MQSQDERNSTPYTVVVSLGNDEFPMPTRRIPVTSVTSGALPRSLYPWAGMSAPHEALGPVSEQGGRCHRKPCPSFALISADLDHAPGTEYLPQPTNRSWGDSHGTVGIWLHLLLAEGPV